MEAENVNDVVKDAKEVVKMSLEDDKKEEEAKEKMDIVKDNENNESLAGQNAVSNTGDVVDANKKTETEDKDNAEEVKVDEETQQEEKEELNTPADNNNTNGVVQVGDLPLEWTQLGKCEDPESSLPIRYPKDVEEIFVEDMDIMIVGTHGQKITKMGGDFHKEVNPKLESLIFRSHLIREMEGLDNLNNLRLLELYDNQIIELNIPKSVGMNLITLDMSFNVIRDMAPVQFCPNLEELYIANNKLKKIVGISGLKKLKKLDLGANRIRKMDENELSGLESIEELWLGKNKIEKIEGLEKLTKLRRLDVQSNRLTEIENLTSLVDTLEELYLASNGITTEGALIESGLPQKFKKLSVLDLSRNRLTNTTPFQHLTTLEELWISGNEIKTFDDVKPLAALAGSHSNTGSDESKEANDDNDDENHTGLETLYLEYNPVADEFDYRKQLATLIPSLKQIDATLILGYPSSSNIGGLAETVEEKNRRLQEAIILRAKRQEQQAQQEQQQMQAQQEEQEKTDE